MNFVTNAEVENGLYNACHVVNAGPISGAQMQLTYTNKSNPF